jgi:O-antigen/teichoic acid export membrane protein
MSARGRPLVVLVLFTTVILASESWRLTASDTLIGLGATGWSAMLAHQVRAIVVTVAVAMFLIVTSGALDIERLLAIMAAVTVALALLGAYRIARVPGRSVGGPPVDLRGAITTGLPFVLVDLVVVVVARGDVWLAAAFFPEQDAALYGTGSVLASQVGVPIGLASIALAPVVAGHAASNRLDLVERSIRRLITVTLYVLGPILIGAIVFGRPFLALAYGSTYADAHPYLLVLLAGNLTLALLGAAPVVLLMTNCHRDAMKVGAVWFGAFAPVVVAAAALGGPIGLAVASATATVGLYTAMAVAAWTATGIALVPYLRPSNLELARLLKNWRAEPTPALSTPATPWAATGQRGGS